MQRKQNKPASQKAPVATSGKTRRRKGTVASRSGLYRTPQVASKTPGAVSLPMVGYRGQSYSIPRGVKVTSAGMAFLKCAFAPPDFGTSLSTGVPDSFEGSSLVKKHRGIYPNTCKPSMDRYILLLPMPGIAYFQADVAADTAILATTIFYGVPYSDFTSMFGDNSGQFTGDVVDKFRFVSNHIELVPTVNAMTWTGAVQCWKLPITTTLRNNLTGGSFGYSILGLQGCNAANPNQYTAPFNNGVYCGAYSAASTFQFQQIMENQITLPQSPADGDFGQLSFSPPIGHTTGFDNNFESVLIKISGVGTNTNDSYILKTWACVEYQVVTGSSLYEFQSLSPCDEVAMLLYKRIIKELPVAKTYMDNDTFWQHVLNIIKMVSGGLSFLPGPYGQIAGGVNAVANLIS